jgi:hypothetical protein
MSDPLREYGKLSEEERKRLEKRLEDLMFPKHVRVQAKRILDGRYAECDSKKHKGPKTKGVCQHCYRHYSYSSDYGRRVAKSREGLPEMMIPCDLPAIEEQERLDIQGQKGWDRAIGLRTISEELMEGKKGLIARLKRLF